jgi:hypothetical protein
MSSNLTPESDNDLIDENEVSRMTGGAIKPGTLQQWRWNERGGPEYIDFGRRIRYRRGVVKAWIQSLTRTPAATRIAQDAQSVQKPAFSHAKQNAAPRSAN